jgi:hypothetical protein
MLRGFEESAPVAATLAIGTNGDATQGGHRGAHVDANDADRDIR